MENERFFGLAGLAAKAGKAVYGAAACDAGIKSGKVKLVLADGGASERTKKDFESACAYYRTKLIVLEEENILERCLGRTGNKLVGITDAGFAEKIVELYGVRTGGEKL